MDIENEQSARWDSNGFNIYANSDYHYEDAALLAKLWNIPVTEAKQAIGHKIINEIENLLPAEVQALHKEHSNEKDHHSSAIIGERQAITIKGTDYTLQARVLWGGERPASGLSVAVYDKDILQDDFLGKTITTEDGGFDISFAEKDFKGLFCDHKPDLYFIITDADGKELLNTKESAINNADEKTPPITLTLD